MSKEKKIDKPAGEKEQEKQEETPPEENKTTNGNHVKRMYRSTSNKMIGGVCAGVGDYFGIDPTLVRIGFVASLFAGGAGFFAYVIAWMILPEGDSEAGQIQSTGSGPMLGIIFGAFIIFMGLGLFFDNFRYRWFFPRYLFDNVFSFETFFGMLLIAIGGFVIYSIFKKDKGIDILGTPPAARDKQKSTAQPHEPGRTGSTLYRSRIDKKVSGVIGGLGEYLGFDANILRVIFIVVLLITAIFPGLIIYFIMAVVIPETPLIQEDTV